MDKYKLKITGPSLRYFLNNLIKNKIELYYIKEEKNYLIIIVSTKDYEKIKKMKTVCKIKILNRYGISKIKYLIYKYRYMLLFFLISLFLIITLSRTIFEIEIIHTKKEIRDLLLKDLNTYGIKKYSFVKDYQEKEDIKKKILNKEKEKIEWLEIDKIGTKYIIHVEERKKRKKEEDNIPRDIVAKKDAMILKIDAFNGEVRKKKYDYVRKGEVIVSGTIKNKEDEVSKIKADGIIVGEVWYKIKVEIPKKYYEENKTGRKKEVLSLNLLDKSFAFSFNSFEDYDENKDYIVKDFILPIGISISTRYEKTIISKNYTINTIDDKAISFARSKFNKKDILLEKVLKKTEKDSKIITEVFFKVREDITEYKKIEDLELKKEAKDE